jgi:thiosulfate dehydrogenase [quinone] large subunit
MTPSRLTMTTAQQAGLVVLRTLVGWHFLYEGVYKLVWPAWSRAGAPLSHWSAAGYLRGASGPLAGVFHAVAGSPLLRYVDMAMPIALAVVGLLLMLGLFTRLACVAALALLALFYVSAIPTAGVPQPGAEGAYLLVNKNLIEAAAVFVLLVFRTERLAGLDLLRDRSSRTDARPEAA